MEKRSINRGVNTADYKILVVDDVVSNILLLKALLKSENYQIITANNGEQALKKVESELPDLILLDIMMQGLSGFDVSRKLKSSDKYSDIPIIFLTALNGHEDIVTGFKLGANDFISKPFNKNELKIRILHQVSLIESKRIIVEQANQLSSTIATRDKIYSVVAQDLIAPLGSIKMTLNYILKTIDDQNSNNIVIDKNIKEMLQKANQTTENILDKLGNMLK